MKIKNLGKRRKCFVKYEQLRKEQKKVWHGKLAGKLLADVLEADLLEIEEFKEDLLKQEENEELNKNMEEEYGINNGLSKELPAV